jgi:hypothetical protein
LIFSHFYSVYQHWSVLSFLNTQTGRFFDLEEFFYHHTGYQNMWN